ncbi:MAG: hypothetical protein RI897_4407 [Verrucomicrobiota bacterium]
MLLNGVGAGRVAGMRRELRHAVGWVGLVILVVMGAGCSSVPEMMPTPNMYLGGGAFRGVPEVLRSNVVDVMYVTDREPTSTLGGQLTYSYKRMASLGFGSAFVSLGKDVSWEDLVRDSQVRKRGRDYPVFLREVWERGRFPETPYVTRRDADGGWVADDDALRQEAVMSRVLRQELMRRLEMTSRKEVVVMVHGFNNDFQYAVGVAAQLWHFMEREGVMVSYTWPAGIGGVRGYAYDRESGEYTVHHLKQFLRMLLSCEGVERVHLVAHSRGTDVLTTALRELVLEERGRTGDRLVRLGVVANLVLAAPDLDVQVAGQRIAAEYLNTAVGRFTVYVCQEDRAINLSNWLFEGVRRLGVLSPSDLTKQQLRKVAKAENTHVIDVQGGAGFLSHGYFYENPAASSDLLLLLREDCDPGVGGVRPLEPLVEQFWVLEEDYPVGAGGVAER